MTSNPAPRLAAAIEEYLDDCRLRGLAPKTYNRAYGWPLRRLLLPFAEQEGIASLAELDQAALNRLSLGLQPRVAKASAKAYLKAINMFLAWAERRTEAGSARAIEPQLRKIRREVLSRDELAALEEAAPTERDRIILRLMADSGAREGEVASIRLSDLVARDRAYFVRIRGKTGERLPPVAPQLHARLKRYAERARPASSSDRLFLALRRGRSGDYEALTESGIYQLVKEAAARAGIERRVYPHLLRHSAITWMIARGMHPALVSEICGVSIQVIASHYSHPSDRDRYDALMRALMQ